jgi:hypothetical protein
MVRKSHVRFEIGSGLRIAPERGLHHFSAPFMPRHDRSRQIMSAGAAAQLGNRDALNSLVGEAAQHFGTDPDTMKAVIRELHAGALNGAGIDL